MATQNWILLLVFGVIACFELSHMTMVTGPTLDDIMDNVNFQLQRLGTY